jgi:hypothetical protein
VARNSPTVTLTFAGDSKQITRSADDGGNAIDKLRDKIDKSSTEMARSTKTSTEQIKSSYDSQTNSFRTTAESFEDMVDRMAKAKRRADQTQRNIRLLGLDPSALGSADQAPAQRAGEDAGDGFLRGFGQRVSAGLKSVGSGPGIGAAIAAIPGLFGPIGLLAGGAIVTGIGAGLAGIGLVVAAKSPLVAAHFERLKVNVQAKMMQISKPFEQTMIDIAAGAQKVFNSIAPELDKVFPQAAKDISEFVGHLTEGFRQLAPVIAPVMDAFGKILDSLGPKMPGVFQDIANALIPLAEIVGKNSDGFAKIIVFMLGLIPVAINLITKMIEFGMWWGGVWRGVGDAISAAWGVITDIFGRIGDSAQRVGAFVGDVFGQMKEAVQNRLREVLSGARDLPSAFRAALGDIGRVLWDAGNRLIGGLIDGIRAKFGEVRSLLANLTGMLPQWKGPVSVDAKLLTNNGRLIIGSLVDGFRQEEPDVRSYLNDLTGFIGGFGPSAGSLAAPTPRGSGREVLVIRSDGSPVGDLLVTLLQPTINARGGNAQEVLGS